MNKQDLAIDVAVKFFLTQTESEKIIEFVFKKMAEDLKKGKRVYFRGFGTFKKIKRKARSVRHPKTKKMMSIPAHWTVKFTPSEALQKKMSH